MTEQQQLPGMKYKYRLDLNGEMFGCYTATEVWAKIGEGPFFSCYSVSSPNGEDVSEFIPL